MALGIAAKTSSLDFLGFKDVLSVTLTSTEHRDLVNEWSKGVFAQLRGVLEKKIDQPWFNPIDKTMLTEQCNKARFQELFKRGLGITAIKEIDSFLNTFAQYEAPAKEFFKALKLQFSLDSIGLGSFRLTDDKAPQTFIPIFTPQGQLESFFPFPTEEVNSGSRIELSRKYIQRSEGARAFQQRHPAAQAGQAQPIPNCILS